MTRRRTAALVLGAAVVVTVALVQLTGRGSAPASLADTVHAGVPAVAPFRGLTVARVRVGEQPLRVVVADEPTERVQGLRGREGPDPYGGMLFVFDGTEQVAFTMAGVPADLAIGFYDAAGRPVDRQLMRSCGGTDATCPVYRSRSPFRFALETKPGEIPKGRLRSAG